LPDSVDAMRWHIEEVDNQILDMIGQRMRLANKMGLYKAGRAAPVRNLRVEDQVIARYASRAKESGISEEAAAEIARLLIRESVDAQMRIPKVKDPKRITIVGGSGKMGSWLSRFFAERGHKVMVHDIVSSTRFPFENDLRRAVAGADVVVLATPIGRTPEMLESVLALKPKALVFDVSSVKESVVPILKKAAAKKVRVSSVHPMFGPDTRLLLDKNLVICDCGSDEGTKQTKELFEGVGLNVRTIKVEKHDEIIAYVLGVSHAVNIAFFNALVKSGHPYNELKSFASTTFDRQENAAKGVAGENPELYYEIQHVNPHTQEVLDLLVESVEEVRKAATEPGGERFVEMMEAGRKYFGGIE